MVRNVMNREVLTASPDESLTAAAARLLRSGRTALPVIDAAGRLVGVLSEADLLALAMPESVKALEDAAFLPPGFDPLSLSCASNPPPTPVGDVMHTEPLYAVEEDAALAEAALLMLRHGLDDLPVVSAGRLVGIVGRRDILRALLASAGDSTGSAP